MYPRGCALRLLSLASMNSELLWWSHGFSPSHENRINGTASLRKQGTDETCLTALLQPGHLSPDGLNKRAEQAETRDPNTRRRLLNKAFEQNLNKG